METNMSKGTMMILHSCLVNSAADLMTAAAILIFLKLQQSVSIDRPAATKQTYPAILNISGFVHSSYPSMPSFATTIHPTPSPISPARYNPMMTNTMQLPHDLMKARSTMESSKLPKIAIIDIFHVTLRSLMTRSK